MLYEQIATIDKFKKMIKLGKFQNGYINDQVAPVKIGVIDGAIDSTHPDFENINIQSLPAAAPSYCLSNSSLSCKHGTFVTGIISAKPSSRAPGICPNATILSRPVFCEANDFSQCPIVTPQLLSDAIREVVDEGAQVINLSLGLSKTSIQMDEGLNQAFDYAKSNDTLIVGASGNHGKIGHNPLFDHPWVIPVVACDHQGKLIPQSNIGMSIGRRGIMALGKDVVSTSSGGGYLQMSGTSAAAPFVTGAIGLLRSVFPNASAQEIRHSITHRPGFKKSIVPPLMDIDKSEMYLKSKANQQFITVNHKMK